MGAISFAAVYTWHGDNPHLPTRAGHVNANDAYDTLRSEDPRTMSGTSLWQIDNTPVTLAQAEARATNNLDPDEDDDWTSLVQKGECRAIALLEETPAVWEDTGVRTVTVTVPGDVYADHVQLQAVIARTLKVTPEQVNGWNVVAVGGGFEQKMTKTVTVTTTASKGKTQTRYFPILDGDTSIPDWDKGYATQAQARAALDDRLTRVLSRPSMFAHTQESGEVLSMTRRVTGEPLVTGTGTVKKVTVELDVQTRTLVSKAKVGTRQGGWFFYGLAPD